MIRPALFVLAGLAGLTAFGWLLWPPLALLPCSLSCLLMGLLVDWEAPRGKPAPPNTHEQA